MEEDKSVLDPDKLEVINWDDLDGKMVRVRLTRHEGYLLKWLIDEETDTYNLIDIELEGETNEHQDPDTQ